LPRVTLLAIIRDSILYFNYLREGGKEMETGDRRGRGEGEEREVETHSGPSMMVISPG
jgi:hypothetical protein